MSYIKKSIPKRLTFTREAINIVKTDPELSVLFAANDFSTEELDVGLELENQARILHMDQQVTYGIRLEAAGAARALGKVVKKTFADDRRIAKIALQQRDGLYEQLRLAGQIEPRREEMVQQALHFYRQVQQIPGVAEVLAEYSLSEALMNNRLAKVLELAKAMEDQQYQRGLARVVTKQRQKAMAAHDEWTRDFIKAAEFLLRKDPSQLEKLGLPVR